MWNQRSFYDSANGDYVLNGLCNCHCEKRKRLKREADREREMERERERESVVGYRDYGIVTQADNGNVSC